MEIINKLLQVVEFEGYKEPEIEWEDEEEEILAAPKETMPKEVLNRGAGRIVTLMREKKIRPYQKPEGLLAVLLSAARNRKWGYEYLKKSVSGYIKSLLTGIFEGDKEAEEKLRSIAGDYLLPQITKESFHRLTRIEVGGGQNDFLLLMHNPEDTHTENWYFSPKGLKHRRKGCSCRTYSARYWDSDALVGISLYSFFKQRLSEEGNTAELLRAELKKRIIERIRSEIHYYPDKIIKVKFPEEWTAENREMLLLFLQENGLPAADPDDYPPDYRFDGAIIRVKDRMSLHLLCDVEFKALDYGSIRNLEYADYDVFSGLIRILKAEDDADRNMENYRKLCGQSATVWMQLKNHTKVNVGSAEKSGFTRYFDFVEFDHDCDLKAVESDFYRDFSAIVETYLGGWHDKTCTLRVRKLGRHKAAGLFFPTLWCLCVDVRYPDSLMHEYGHLYDYAHDELSRKWEFFYIRERYEELLREACAGKEKEMFGSSKYDLDYYLTPTEVFARCFELWLVRCCKVDNSTVKPDKKKEFAYPDDPDLMTLIENYFDKEFERVQLPAVVYGFGNDMVAV